MSRLVNRPGRIDHQTGFALVTVIWLAGIGLLSSLVLLGLLSSRTRSLEDSRHSMERAVALDELIGRIERSSLFLPENWTAPKDTLIRVGTPEYLFRVSCRRWGLWAIAEIIESDGEDEILAARRVIAGSRSPSSGVVGFVRSNRYPVVIAHQAQIHGTLVVADSVVTQSWKGMRFSGPRPSYRSGVEDFPTGDIWGGFQEQVKEWGRDLLSIPDGIQLLAGPATLREPPVDDIHTVVVLGDLRISGDWRNHTICLYATGDIELRLGTYLSGQLLAEGEVEIIGAYLEWPSLVLSSSQSGSDRPVVALRDGTWLEGAIVSIRPGKNQSLRQDNEVQLVSIDASSTLIGSVHATGALQMSGSLRGWVEVGETFEQIEPATYHNWILGGTWSPRDRGDPLPLFPLELSHGPYRTAVIGGLR